MPELSHSKHKTRRGPINLGKNSSTKKRKCKHQFIDYTCSPPVCTMCARVLKSTLEFSRNIMHSGESSEQLGITFIVEKTSGLHQDIRGANFPRDVVETANTIFKEFLCSSKSGKKSRITRSWPRRSLIFACVYVAFRVVRPSTTVNPHVLAVTLGLKDDSGRPSRKLMGQGIRTLLGALTMAQHMIVIVDPVHLVESLMRSYSISPIHHMPEVIELYRYIRTKCRKLADSKPTSVAAALFWLWYNMKPEDDRTLEIGGFARSASLCNNTIVKLAGDMQACIPYFDRHPSAKAIQTGARKRRGNT